MKKCFLLFCVCLLCFLLPVRELHAQNISISGRVTDEQTGEGIPFASVFVKGSITKFTADFDGYYRITIKTGNVLLVAGCIGYEPLTLKIPAREKEFEMNFSLLRAEYKLQKAQAKSEAQAMNIMRHVILRKSAADKNKLSSYGYEAYTRIEIDLDELTNRFENRKVFRPFKFVFNDIDSLSEARPFLPFFLSETVSDFYFLKNRFLTREIIKASKVSGISDVNVAQFLGSTYVSVDIYSDYIVLLKRDFLSPVSPAGISSYNYFLLDSQVIDHFKCYKIRFIPKSDKELRLEGEMWVTDSVFAIKQISMRSRGGSDLNLIHTISVYNEFAPVKDSLWMLKREKIAVHFLKPSSKTPELVARKLASYKNFIINEKQKVLDSIFKIDKPDILVRDSAKLRSDAYWMPYWKSTPYFQEQKVYYMLDTLKNMRLMKNYINLMQTVFFGYVDAGPVSIGSIYSFIGENNIEGWRFKFGLRTSTSLSSHVRVGAYIAYGLQDKKVKYGADAIWVIKRSPRTHLAASFRSDLTSTSNYNIFFFNPDLVTTYGLRRIEAGTDIPYKIDEIRELKVDLYHEFKFGYSLDVGFTNRYLNPMGGFNFSYLTGAGDAPANTVITNGTITEFSLTQRIAWQERFVSGDFKRISLGSKYPTAYLQYSVGVRGIIKSQFSYQRLAAGINDSRLLGPLGKINYNIEAGKIFGTLPYLFLQIADASETYISSWTGFNTIPKYQFAADRYAKIILEHHLEGLLFDQIPGFKKLKLREVYGARMWWGDMTNPNLVANYANLAINPNNLGLVKVQTAAKTPFFEMNAGIENILTFFRIDMVWRLTYLDPRGTRFSFRYGNFGVRLGFNLQF